MTAEENHFNRNILCVDDEEGVLASYENILQPRKDLFDEMFVELFESQEGHSESTSEDDSLRFHVTIANSGNEAVRIVKEEWAKGNRFAAGFFDMRMPGIDGYETIRQAREIDPDLHCAVVTAYTDRKVRQIRKLFAGEHRDELLYFQKPFSGEELYQAAYNMVMSWNRKRKAEEYIRLIEQNKKGLEHILNAVHELAVLPPRSLHQMLSGVLCQILAFVEAENGYIVIFNDSGRYWMSATVGRFDGLDIEKLIAGDEPSPPGRPERDPLVDGIRCSIPLSYCKRRLGLIHIEGNHSLERALSGEILKVFKNQMEPLILNSIFYDEILSKEHEVLTDPLTGLYNRRFITKWFYSDLEKTSRCRYPISVLMLDIDDFKNINDNHGHDVGDRVLKEIAGILHETVRNYDIVKFNARQPVTSGHYAIRYGGEEFMIILTHTGEEGARGVGERIRGEIADKAFTHGEVSLRITISIGIASGMFSCESSQGEIFLNRLTADADSALYRAKSLGKNRVEVGR